MRFALRVLGVAVLHFIASFLVTFAGGTMGGPYAVAAKILGFPLSLFRGPDNALLGWLGWVLLSLFWGLAICSLVRLATR